MLSQERCLISSPPGNRSYGVKLRGSYGCFAYMTLSRSCGRSGTVVYMITSWSKDLSSVLGVILFYVASWSKTDCSLSCYSFESFRCNFKAILVSHENIP